LRAVLAAFLKSEALGAPADPGLRIVSPDPALIRLRLACMLAYSPFLAILVTFALAFFLFARALTVCTTPTRFKVHFRSPHHLTLSAQ